MPVGIAITPDQAPPAAFTATPAASGSPTSFDASGSSDPDGTVAKYRWNFGDGSAKAVTDSNSIDHTYAHGGYYRVVLRVNDNERCSNSQTASFNGSASARISQRVAIVPTVNIDSHPPASTSDTDATFEFSSDDPKAHFRCRLLSASGSESLIPCTSPQEYLGLTPSRYVFKVVASDGPGNAALTRWVWRVTG